VAWINNQKARKWIFFVAILLMIAMGFYWRWIYVTRISLFVDEFVTLLAAKMIVQEGIPRMPSGLFYDNGLLFSYVVAVFIRLTGFSETVARFPSILFSLLSVAVTFRMGKRFFSLPVALLASAIVALSPELVIWGARSRAYAQFQLWGIVGIWAMAERFTQQRRGRWRALFWLAVAAAALSNLAGVVLMMSCLAAALPAWYLWQGRERRMGLRHQLCSLWLDGLLAVVLLLGMAAITAAGKPGWVEPMIDPVSTAQEISLSPLARVSWVDLLGLVGLMLVRPQYVPWTILLLVNLVILLQRAITRKLRRTDAILLYLQGVWLMTVSVLTVVSPWHAPRYVLPLMPVFFLLGSHEMANATRKLLALSFRKRALASSPWTAIVIVIWVSALLWNGLHRVTTVQEYGYDIAFRYVQTHWREGDAIMTFNASGSYIYLGQCDYFPIQRDISLLNTAAGPVERATGARWIGSAAQLDAALAQAPRTWYMIDDGRFGNRHSPEVRDAILARFQPVFKERGVQVFLYERRQNE
jgi:4-amino-4-deoxy-L-arabinose transferase-like glycosyltransferase